MHQNVNCYDGLEHLWRNLPLGEKSPGQPPNNSTMCKALSDTRQPDRIACFLSWAYIPKLTSERRAMKAEPIHQLQGRARSASPGNTSKIMSCSQAPIPTRPPDLT